MAKHDVEFDYFHGYESEQFAFYRIPKVLFTMTISRICPAMPKCFMA